MQQRERPPEELSGLSAWCAGIALEGVLLSGEAALLTGAIGIACTGGVGRIRPLSLDFHWVWFEKETSGAPKVHAHLSPFSWPEESYQAPGLAGSLRASESSWPLTLAMAARPCECSPDVSCGSQPASPSSLKKYAN
jgi:hypothetical protein